jgi:hypothetical protein
MGENHDGMAAETSAEARRAKIREMVGRAADARAESAALIEISRELRARMAELKRQIATASQQWRGSSADTNLHLIGQLRDPGQPETDLRGACHAGLADAQGDRVEQRTPDAVALPEVSCHVRPTRSSNSVGGDLADSWSR